MNERIYAELKKAGIAPEEVAIEPTPLPELYLLLRTGVNGFWTKAHLTAIFNATCLRLDNVIVNGFYLRPRSGDWIGAS